MRKLSHKKQQSQALSLPLPSSVLMFTAHHSQGQRPSRTCVGSYLLHTTHNISVWSASLSALPERNITIQAFALVRISAELKANLLKTLPSPWRASPIKALSLLTLQSRLPPAWLAAGLPGSAPVALLGQTVLRSFLTFCKRSFFP